MASSENVSVLYDTHAHLDYPEYAPDLDAALERAKVAGVAAIVCVGTDLESSARAIALAEQYPQLYAAVGWHPNNATEAPRDLRPRLAALAKHPRVVAVGETGLDYYRLPGVGNPAEAHLDGAIKDRQREVFIDQLEVAVEAGKNLIVHERAAFDDTMAVFAPYAGRLRAVFHCFVGNVDSMRRVIELGSLVSFTGILTFKNGASVRETLAATPRDRFMVETDAPYLAPVPYRGKRCEPAYVRHTAEAAAQTLGMPPEAFGELTCRTAEDFFVGLRRP